MADLNANSIMHQYFQYNGDIQSVAAQDAAAVMSVEKDIFGEIEFSLPNKRMEELKLRIKSAGAASSMKIAEESILHALPKIGVKMQQPNLADVITGLLKHALEADEKIQKLEERLNTGDLVAPFQPTDPSAANNAGGGGGAADAAILANMDTRLSELQNQLLMRVCQVSDKNDEIAEEMQHIKEMVENERTVGMTNGVRNRFDDLTEEISNAKAEAEKLGKVVADLKATGLQAASGTGGSEGVEASSESFQTLFGDVRKLENDIERLGEALANGLDVANLNYEAIEESLEAKAEKNDLEPMVERVNDSFKEIAAMRAYIDTYTSEQAQVFEGMAAKDDDDEAGNVALGPVVEQRLSELEAQIQSNTVLEEKVSEIERNMHTSILGLENYVQKSVDARPSEMPEIKVDLEEVYARLSEETEKIHELIQQKPDKEELMMSLNVVREQLKEMVSKEAADLKGYTDALHEEEIKTVEEKEQGIRATIDETAKTVKTEVDTKAATDDLRKLQGVLRRKDDEISGLKKMLEGNKKTLQSMATELRGEIEKSRDDIMREQKKKEKREKSPWNNLASNWGQGWAYSPPTSADGTTSAPLFPGGQKPGQGKLPIAPPPVPLSRMIALPQFGGDAPKGTDQQAAQAMLGLPLNPTSPVESSNQGNTRPVITPENAQQERENGISPSGLKMLQKAKQVSKTSGALRKLGSQEHPQESQGSPQRLPQRNPPGSSMQTNMPSQSFYSQPDGVEQQPSMYMQQNSGLAIGNPNAPQGPSQFEITRITEKLKKQEEAIAAHAEETQQLNHKNLRLMETMQSQSRMATMQEKQMNILREQVKMLMQGSLGDSSVSESLKKEHERMLAEEKKENKDKDAKGATSTGNEGTGGTMVNLTDLENVEASLKMQMQETINNQMNQQLDQMRTMQRLHQDKMEMMMSHELERVEALAASATSEEDRYKMKRLARDQQQRLREIREAHAIQNEKLEQRHQAIRATGAKMPGHIAKQGHMESYDAPQALGLEYEGMRVTSYDSHPGLGRPAQDNSVMVAPERRLQPIRPRVMSAQGFSKDQSGPMNRVGSAPLRRPFADMTNTEIPAPSLQMMNRFQDVYMNYQYFYPPLEAPPRVEYQRQTKRKLQKFSYLFQPRNGTLIKSYTETYPPDDPKNIFLEAVPMNLNRERQMPPSPRPDRNLKPQEIFKLDSSIFTEEGGPLRVKPEEIYGITGAPPPVAQRPYTSMDSVTKTQRVRFPPVQQTKGAKKKANKRYQEEHREQHQGPVKPWTPVKSTARDFFHLDGASANGSRPPTQG